MLILLHWHATGKQRLHATRCPYSLPHVSFCLCIDFTQDCAPCCCHPAGGNLKQRDLEVADPLFGEGAVVRRRRLSGMGAAVGGGLAPTDPSLVAPDEE